MTFTRPKPLLRFLGLSMVAILPIAGRSQAPQREAEKTVGIKRVLVNRTFEMTPAVRASVDT